MCAEDNEKPVAVTFDENGTTILPSCVNSDKCGGGCKHAAKLLEMSQQVPAISSHPTLIIDGKEKPFVIKYA